MKKQDFKLALPLLLCCPVLVAEPLAAPRQSVNFFTQNATSTPVTFDSASSPATQSTALLLDSRVNLAETINRSSESFSGDVKNDELKDPTLINQRFRDALQKPMRNKGSFSSNSRDVREDLSSPDIKLLASITGGRKNKSAAMLRVNDRTEMVYAGDKITSFDKNQLVEIKVLEIQEHGVTIHLLPPGTTIVLR